MTVLRVALRHLIPSKYRPRLKALWRGTVYPLRRLTVAMRSLPDIVVIGAQKSGTTSLHHYLCQHPAIRGGLTQETHFFGDNYQKGEQWYRAQFPLSRNGKLLDVTPGYMFKKKCFERMRRIVPDAKLIAILREPVSRAYSHYRHICRKEKYPGTTPPSFREAIAPDIERLEQGEMLGCNGHYACVRRSVYAPQLERFKESYGDDLLVLRSEDMFESPNAVTDRVFEFLGLSSHRLRDMRGRNKSSNGQDRAIPMRDELQKLFGPYNEELYELLDIDDPWWPY